jgi:hypothetical protein
MKVQAAKRALLLQEWADQIREHKQSGMTLKQWTAKTGYSDKTYYYRLKRVREELLEAAEVGGAICLGEKPVFAALPMPTVSGMAVTVRIGQYSIEIHNNADAGVVEQALRVVSRL